MRTASLYGTTAGAGSGGNGTAFEPTPPGTGETLWSEKVLYRFKGGADGSHPEAGLIMDTPVPFLTVRPFGAGTCTVMGRCSKWRADRPSRLARGQATTPAVPQNRHIRAPGSPLAKV